MQIARAPQAQRGVSTLMHIGDSGDGLGAVSIDPTYLAVGSVASSVALLYGVLSGNKTLRNIGVAGVVGLSLLGRRLGHPQKARAERNAAQLERMLKASGGR